MPRKAKAAGPKLLLVDDDVMVVKMYSRKLEKEGFDLTVAYNGEEGLEALKGFKKGLPDLVLADIMMPRMNGLDFMKAVKADKRYEGIPVVLLTNLGDREEDVAIAKRFGAYDYWVKAHLTLADLVSRVKSILAGKTEKS